MDTKHNHNVVYDRDYFIRKFEAIPGDRWLVGDYIRDGRCCALGHCGARDRSFHTPESDALRALFAGGGSEVVDINNGGIFFRTEPDPSARDRILTALRALPA